MRLLFAALVFLTGGLLGCDSASNDDSAGATVVLSIAPVQTASKGAGHISYTRVRILLRTIQFHHRGDANDDSTDFRVEPLVAELSLDGTPTTLDVADIEPGSYHKISFRVHKPDDTEQLTDSDFRDGDSGNDRYSVIVEGMFEDQPFTYRSRKSFHQQVTLDPDLVIDGTETGSVEVSLEVDLSGWFMDSQGQLLSPMDVSGSGRSQIDKSIRDSFRGRGPAS